MHSARTFRLFALVAICVILLAAAWGAVAWVGWRIIALDAAVAGAQQDLATAKAKAGSSEALRTQLRDTADDRAAIHAVSSLSAIDIVDRISSVAHDAGVDASIDTVAPATQSSAALGSIPVLAVSLSAHDSFTRLYRFLELLQTSSLPLSIDQISLDQLASTPNVPWTLTARLLVYTEASTTQ